MRQIVTTALTIFSSLSIAISGLVFSPANAVDSVLIESCATGTYKVTTVGSEVTVTDGSTCTGDVVIPAGVTSIDSLAFTGADSLTSIDIPASVKAIGFLAFYDATSLNSITFMDHSLLTDIGDAAFARTAFNSMTIPNGVTSIGESAFAFSALSSIDIPGGITTLSRNLFASSESLTAVTFPANSELTSIRNSAFFGTSISEITIPAGVSLLEEGALSQISSLKNIYFLGDAPTVEVNAFRNTLPKAHIKPGALGFTLDVENLWNGLNIGFFQSDGTYPCGSGTYIITSNVVNAGSSCTGDLAFPEGITSITDGAFRGASGLTAITIPASVTRIGSLAFVNNAALTAITVDAGNSEYSSANGVLFDKISTTLLAYPAGKPTNTYLIPASVRTIADFAFAGAYSLTSLAVEAGNANYAAADGVLFDILSQTLIAYPSGKVTSPYLIPASVTSIGVGAFAGAAELISITIPVGVTSIGYAAFYGASALTSVTIPVGVTFIESSVFELATSLTSITIPAGVTYIDSFAFANATALANVTIPASVSYIGIGAFEGASSLKIIYFLGNAPASDPVGLSPFTNIGSSAKALIKSSATGFALDGTGKWNGLTVENVDPPAVNPPNVDLITQVAAKDLAARTLKVRSKISGKALARRVGVRIVSSKAIVTFTVSKASKKVCTKSGPTLKTISVGKCVVTFTVQEPKPRIGKKPKATKAVKSIVVK